MDGTANVARFGRILAGAAQQAALLAWPDFSGILQRMSLQAIKPIVLTRFSEPVRP